MYFYNRVIEIREIDMIQPIELEWHQLELRYADIRIHTDLAVRRLMSSIHTHGLLDPISVVQPEPTDRSHFIVIDGYLRLRALKALHQDTILALILSLNTQDALISLYRQGNSRMWEAYEEAQLIQTLLAEHQLSQTQVAQLLGKSKTWVTHRLQLLHDLPDFVQTAIRQGALSTWSAHRILLPFARANADHAKKLIDYLGAHTHASRDIQAYYHHYLRSNRQTRQNMIDNPQHFFKVRLFQMQSDSSFVDKLAPEYIWEGTLSLCLSKLQVLSGLLPAIFYPKQSHNEQATLMEPFMALFSQINQLKNLIRSSKHAKSPHETNSTSTLSCGKEHSPDQ